MLERPLSSHVIAMQRRTPKDWQSLELKKRQRMRSRYNLAVWFWRFILVGGFLLLWETAALAGWVNTFFTSSPTAVIRFVLVHIHTQQFWSDTWVTVQEAYYGFGLAAIAGIGAAFVMAQSRLLRDVADPILSFFNSLPRVAFAPLFVAFFGLGLLSKVVLAFSLCFFIVLNGALVGLKNIDTDCEMLTRLLGATPRQHFFKLLVPSALPSIFSALRLALIYSFLAVVVGEMVGSNAGLGQQIAFYSGMLRTDAVFGLVLVLGLIATLSVEILRRIESYLLRWQ